MRAAFAEAARLPDTVQETIAHLVRAEIEVEYGWDKRFSDTQHQPGTLVRLPGFGVTAPIGMFRTDVPLPFRTTTAVTLIVALSNQRPHPELVEGSATAVPYTPLAAVGPLLQHPQAKPVEGRGRRKTAILPRRAAERARRRPILRQAQDEAFK